MFDAEDERCMRTAVDGLGVEDEDEDEDEVDGGGGDGLFSGWVERDFGFDGAT